MAEALKVLGQVAIATASSTPNTDLYKVPPSTQTVVASIVVHNRNASNAVGFALAVCPAGAALDEKHYLFSGGVIPVYGTTVLTLGLTLGAGDVIRVSGASTTVRFSAFGQEIS